MHVIVWELDIDFVAVIKDYAVLMRDIFFFLGGRIFFEEVWRRSGRGVFQVNLLEISFVQVSLVQIRLVELGLVELGASSASTTL